MNKYLANAGQAPYPEDSELATLTLFETGCRAGEGMRLHRGQASWNDECLVFYRVPVTKRRGSVFRDVIILRRVEDPWCEVLIERLEAAPDGYLFPRLTPFTREPIPGSHVSRKTLWSRVSDVDPYPVLPRGKQMWPHGLRGLRASMLVAVYGFSVQMLVSWFEWKNANMALHYTRTRDLAKALGVGALPSPRRAAGNG